MTECDARLQTDDDGTPGRMSVIVSRPTGAEIVSVPVTGCAGPIVAVWHGLPTPAYVCDRHTQHLNDLIGAYRGHRVRIGASR